MSTPMVDTGRILKNPLPDFIRLVEELKSLKNRLQNLEMARLEEKHQQDRESAMKMAQKGAHGGRQEQERLQIEAKKIADADHERSREMLAAKYQKLDVGISGLSRFLQELVPIKEQEGKIKDHELTQRKMEEELHVQRKVLAHEQEELDREKKLIEAAERALGDRQRDLEKKLANIDVVKRAQDLDQMKEELDGKLKAYEAEVALLAKQRDELNLDFDKLGTNKAELEAEADRLVEKSEAIQRQKASMADTVAREMASTFEAFIRDMLKPAGPEAAPPKPPPPPAKPKAKEPENPAPPPSSPPPDPTSSSFWQ